MALSLANLKRGGSTTPPRLLIYGTKGVGKSSIAASAPSPVFLDIEDGLTSIDAPSLPIKSYADVLDAIGSLYNEEHDFRTVVVDSLDWLEPLIWKHTAEANKWPDIEAPGYGRGYVAAADTWRQFLGGLSDLRNDRGMAILLLAHPEVRRF